MTMRIRPEEPADRPAVQSVIEAAFAPSEPADGPVVESALTDHLRADPDWIPQLTLVAELGGVVVGQVTSSYGVLDDPAGTQLVGVGPVAVAPGHQGAGIGSQLMRAVIAAADATGESAMVLLGSPDFYGRFGFVAAADLGIEAPDPSWGKHFQAVQLRGYRPGMVGRFRYAAPFDRL